ncbi:MULTISPECIES: hypothetical protein [Prauserella salsuginis group]|uniref:DUF1795 domain-containing protein n=1 Tax=Prauserella salsuginis TaxID=387889 RepID=A0ABW6GA46_9PSEU|nr:MULTISPECIES: hypothetical protein [Prauserella salsuginis group]MCR3723068.1 hypothetical protein [Prauserella flava]MCR3732557.1 hypothetical protein [Prauserella salsuginis]
MATTIPVPIEFSLPEGWVSVSPDEIGTPNAAFVALRPDTGGDGFTANITITGEVRDGDVQLSDVAAEAAERLRGGAYEVKVGNTQATGTAENPVYTQPLRIDADVAGRRRYLVQYQVFMGFTDTADPTRRAVIEIVLSSTPETFQSVFADFEEFLGTIRPDQGGAGSGSGTTGGSA